MSLYNFQWFIVGQFAGGGKPCYPEDVAWLVQQGFSAIVSLETTSSVVDRLLTQHGFCRHTVAVETDDHDDIIAPSESELATAAAFVRTAISAGRRVYLHCNTGIQRTPYVARRILPLLGLGTADP